MQTMPTRSILEDLLRAKGPWVSLYCPLSGGGPHARGDRLRYRNLVRDARRRLEARETPPADARGIEDVLRAIGADHGVFSAGAPGLVVLASPGGARSWHLPDAVAPAVAVDERPYLEPLIPFVSPPVHFYTVALSLHGTRLWSCDRYEARPLPLPSDAPTRLEDVAGWEIEEQHLQLHDIRPGKTGPPGNAGNRPIFHGQGGGNDDREVDVEKFIRAVAAAVDEAIPHPDAPVVLACDPAVEPFFRRCTRLSDVVEPALRGNHEHSDDTAVHAAAWSVVASRFEAIERATRARFADLRGTGRTAERIEEVVPAACGGRVDTLFVREGARVRGIFDPDAWRARRTEDELATDLANLAATDTYLNRGRVLVVPPERMPTEAAVAAILRY